MNWKFYMILLMLSAPAYLCAQEQDIEEEKMDMPHDYDKAIGVNLGLLRDAEMINDTKLKAYQLRNLGLLYLKKGEREKGISMLKRSYHEAITNNHTIEANRSMEALQALYKKDKKEALSIKMYEDFSKRLETLILADTAIIDWKLAQLNDEKIAQLEKEQTLKDMLIKKKNNLNTVLAGSVALAVVLLLFIARSLYVNKRQNKKIALQSLRREMNPHFIFNSLNSVNQFIAQNDERAANKYLASYSRLMRNMMENSKTDFVSLSSEIEQMREYLELEQMRFRDKFTYNIEVDETVDADLLLVPNMLIQPQLENAIWHGLRYKEEKGRLSLRVNRVDKKTVAVIVEDDGIGYFTSQRLKTKHQSTHTSRGLTNTIERVNLLNDLYWTHIDIDIEDKRGKETGVIVTITFPYRIKK